MAQILTHHRHEGRFPHSWLECRGCRATCDTQGPLPLVVDSSWRGLGYLYERAPLHPESQVLTADRSRDRQFQRVQAWAKQHAACEDRPERRYVTTSGVQVVDRRRV